MFSSLVSIITLFNATETIASNELWKTSNVKRNTMRFASIEVPNYWTIKSRVYAWIITHHTWFHQIETLCSWTVDKNRPEHDFVNLFRVPDRIAQLLIANILNPEPIEFSLSESKFSPLRIHSHSIFLPCVFNAKHFF